METDGKLSEPVRPLPVVAGDLALDFANTVDDPYGPGCFDHVHDVAGLITWSALVGVVDQDRAARLREETVRHPCRAAELVAGAHDLRRSLEGVFGAVADGAPVPDDAWRSLRTAVAGAIANAAVAVDDGNLRLVWSDDLEGVLDRVAYAAQRLLTGDQLGRVKRCAGCPWLYVDRSKNGSRRWCAMDDCGKHEKMRRYVERRSARRREAHPGVG